MRHIFWAFLLLSMINSACNSISSIETDLVLSKTPFGVCYAKITPEQVQNYKMIIVEPDFYTKTEVDALKRSGTTILAYMTLGEADPNRWYFPLLEQEGFIGVNANWGSSYINLEKETVRNILKERVLPEIMMKGFDGLFLDTIDAVAPYTERRHLEPYMVEIIQSIKTAYPEKLVVQNAGLFLLDETRSSIDAVLIEDIASGYNFEKREYYVKDLSQFNERVEIVRNTSQEYNVPVLIVDFAELESGFSEIRSRLDTLNYPYFISNIQLTKLPNDPKLVSNTLRRE